MRISSKESMLVILLICSTIVLTISALSNDSEKSIPKIPSNVGTAGGRFIPKLESVQTENPRPFGIEIPLIPLEELPDDFEYEVEVSDEKECPDGMYWHIRG